MRESSCVHRSKWLSFEEALELYSRGATINSSSFHHTLVSEVFGAFNLSEASCLARLVQPLTVKINSIFWAR